MSAIVNLCFAPFNYPAILSAKAVGGIETSISVDQWGCVGCGLIWTRRLQAEYCENRKHVSSYVDRYPRDVTYTRASVGTIEGFDSRVPEWRAWLQRQVAIQAGVAVPAVNPAPVVATPAVAGNAMNALMGLVA